MNSAKGAAGSPRRIRRGLLRPGPAENGRWVSHAERAAVTDELSRHYTEGRLDDDEFSRRLDQALMAKTHQDLAGLLHGLP